MADQWAPLPPIGKQNVNTKLVEKDMPKWAYRANDLQFYSTKHASHIVHFVKVSWELENLSFVFTFAMHIVSCRWLFFYWSPHNNFSSFHTRPRWHTYPFRWCPIFPSAIGFGDISSLVWGVQYSICNSIQLVFLYYSSGVQRWRSLFSHWLQNVYFSLTTYISTLIYIPAIALPFLSNTEVFLFPITAIMFIYMINLVGYPFGLGWNASRIIAYIYFEN